MEKLKEGKIYPGTVEGYSSEGLGIVRIFGAVVFVPHAIRGEEIDLKIKMLECHESQIVWMRDHDHIDFADMVRTCSRYRGYQCGADYAEGFRQCQVYLKGTTKRLLP